MESNIIDHDIMDIRTGERHTAKLTIRSHAVFIRDGNEDGSKLVTFEPLIDLEGQELVPNNILGDRIA